LLRNVEDLLHERDIDSHNESIRLLVDRFGTYLANKIPTDIGATGSNFAPSISIAGKCCVPISADAESAGVHINSFVSIQSLQLRNANQLPQWVQTETRRRTSRVALPSCCSGPLVYKVWRLVRISLTPAVRIPVSPARIVMRVEPSLCKKCPTNIASKELQCRGRQRIPQCR
jgi:hypothetical protein